MKKIRVWDLPLRLFHWVLALMIIGSVVTAKIGGNATIWHFRLGYAVLTLMVFRLMWGVVGTYYARFANFVFSPSTMMSYIRGRHERAGNPLGHNPLGSLSVFGLLIVVLMQAIAGLFANDDIAFDGPLVRFISKELSDKVTWFHTEINANVIYALVGLHVTAILYYYLRRKQNLLMPMITGDALSPLEAPAAKDNASTRLLALALLAVAAATVYVVVSVLPAG